MKEVGMDQWVGCKRIWGDTLLIVLIVTESEISVKPREKAL